MTFAVTLGTKTTLGNVTRYEFCVTRNPGAAAVTSASAPSVRITERTPENKAPNTKRSEE
jgi:hypothetical protein